MLMEIAIDRLEEHPANRSFATDGESWDAFCGSIREMGVLQPLLVRPKGKVYEIVAGHRRCRAAGAVGLEAVPCLVKTIGDREALEMLVVENLEREDLDPVEEARGVHHLITAGMSPEEIARRIKRQVRWVRTRQLILELPEEAQEALRRPKDDDRHLHVGTVQLLLDLEPEDRERALQMVLFPEFELRTLSPRQAEHAIEEVIVKPKRLATAWDAGREDLKKEWRKALRASALPGTAEDVQVMVQTWEECKVGRPGRDAQDRVSAAEVRDDAPDGLLWQHVATRHGMAIRIVPEGEGAERSRAVVDEATLRQAEEAHAEHGGEPWLLVGRRTRPTATDDEEEPEADPEMVIEQRMESHAIIDLGPVRRLRAWLANEYSPELSPEEFPEWLPSWCLRSLLEHTLSWVDLMHACDWIEELKRSAE